MERNHLDCSFQFICGEKLDSSLCRRMMWVYADRFLVKNGFNFGPLRKPVAWALRAFLLRDRMTRWMNRQEGNFHAVMFVGADVAAFLSGLVFKDKRLLISRLNINTKYAWYGPGNLLVSATMRHVIEQNRAGKMDIRELDLSQGGDDGMAYKRALGGKVHHTYVFCD